MTTHTCDICKMVIHPDTEVYYSVGDLDKHVPKSLATRVMFQHEGQDIAATTESWTSYEDVDICAACFKVGTMDIMPLFRQREASA